MALRPGQWVSLKSKLWEIPAGTVGIAQPLHPEETYLALDLALSAKGKALQDRVAFHEVDQATGFDTVRVLAVRTDQLEPVTRKDLIPEPRRKTLSPDWEPLP